MNMQSVMPAAEKPVDSRHTSGKSKSDKKNVSGAEDQEMFSELLLLLSASGNHKGMPQVDGPVPLSSGLNHAGDFQEAPLPQSGSFSPVRHLHAGGLQKLPCSQAEHFPLVRDLHTHHEGREGDETVNDTADGVIQSPGMEIPFFVTEGTEAWKGSSDMELFRENLNKHMEQAPEVDVMPEVIPDLAREVIPLSSNESVRSHVHPGRIGIVTQLSDKLADMYHIGGNSAKIRLQPEELGHLHIEISVVDDSIKAVVTVEEKGVKDILETNIDMLLEELKGSGLNIDQFTVNISPSYHDGNMWGGWSGSDRNGREMFSDRSLMQPSIQEDMIMHDSRDHILYAGSGGVNIFV